MKWYFTKGWVYCAFALFSITAVAWAQTEAQNAESPMTVSKGTDVSLEYTLKIEDNKVVDTNVGGEPLTFTQGNQQIIPGLEKELEGMKVGESKHVTVTPEEGYGPENPKAIQEVSKKIIPQEALKEGTQLQGKDENGRVVRPRVKEIKEETVVLDFNHPLAGKTLYFDVTVLDIKPGNVQTP